MAEVTIQQNFQNYCNRALIIQSLNPQELFPHLQSDELLGESKQLTHISEKRETNGYTRTQFSRDIVNMIDDLVKEKGSLVYDNFIKCVEKEHEHIVHEYIVSLLRGKWKSDPQVPESQCLKEAMCKHRKDLQDLNLATLIPRLFQERLLTHNELSMLRDPNIPWSDKDRIHNLINLLDTKGPKAHYIFVQCLKEEGEHPTHRELYQLLFEKDNCYNETESDSPIVKRKRMLDEVPNITVTGIVFKVPKRDPERLVAEELSDDTKQEYLKIMAGIRKAHLKGEWELAEQLVNDSMTSSILNPESKLAIKLESCTGFINRRNEEVVVLRVTEAKNQIKHLQSNSADILLGRCEWVLAKLYRYVGKLDEAKEHIMEAVDINFNTEPGEDTALINYCYACIILERLNKKYSKIEAKRAKDRLRKAIDHANSGNFGLDVSHPHIRLAQLCLGSSPTRPGFIKDSDSLREAQASLDEVKYKSLAPRTKCIYHFTYCDLYRNSGQKEKAIDSAREAMDIASRHSFVTEIESGRSRVTAIEAGQSY